MTARAAIIGGGWAGCAAALTLARAGIAVELYEAARTLGGRARAVDLEACRLDNGQHILLGAYTQTLELLAEVHPDIPEAGLLRLPLAIEQAPGFRLTCPRLPAPLHLLAGLLGARGLSLSEKWAALRWLQNLLRSGPGRLPATVSQLLSGQPEILRSRLWQPLCVSALNTAPEHASAEIFRHVLAAAFGGQRQHSDLLLPRRDLTRMFPEPVARRVIATGGRIHMQTRIRALHPVTGGIALALPDRAATYEHVIIAVAPQHLPGLCSNIPELSGLAATVASYDYQAIATAYLQYPDSVSLSRPMLALSDGPGQFVFDRGRSHGQNGLLAIVVSAASGLTRQAGWLARAERQLARVADLPSPRWRKAIIEKQATYACRPGMTRPDNVTAHPRILLAGDYTAGLYPATLESATLSGVKSAHALLQSL
jgi:squalene-associated FAD-dependent desaturase